MQRIKVFVIQKKAVYFIIKLYSRKSNIRSQKRERKLIKNEKKNRKNKIRFCHLHTYIHTNYRHLVDGKTVSIKLRQQHLIDFLNEIIPTHVHINSSKTYFIIYIFQIC